MVKSILEWENGLIEKSELMKVRQLEAYLVPLTVVEKATQWEQLKGLKLVMVLVVWLELWLVLL